MLSFFVKGEPVAKARPSAFYKNGFMHKYTPAKTRKAELNVKHQIYLQLPKKFNSYQGPLSVTIHIYRSRPKSVKREWPTTRPDCDNYAKLYLDAMNGLVYWDDAQIINLQVSKEYAKDFIEPGAQIQVEEL